MGVQSSSRIQITIPNTERIPLLAYLQKEEIGQIIELTEKTEVDSQSQVVQQELLENLDVVNKTLDIYKTIHPQKKSLLSNFLDSRVLITEKIFSHYDENQTQIIAQAKKFCEQAEKIENLKDRQEILEDIIAKSEPLKDIELDIFSQYKYVSFLAFLIDESRVHLITKQLEDSIEPLVLESVKKIQTDYLYILAVAKKDSKIAEEILEDKATLIHFPAKVSGSFYDIYHTSLEESGQNKKTILKLQKSLARADIQIKDLYILSDVLNSHLALIANLHMYSAKTENSSAIELWVDKAKLPNFMATLNKQLKSYNLTELPTPEEINAPVIMSNPPIIRNFETVTKIMGLPKGSSIDPTPYIALFFPFMFGLALSEAGYALVLILITGFALLHPRLKSGIRDIFVVIFLASILTLIVGALFGSWFGVVPDDINPNNLLPHMQLLVNLGIIPFLQMLQILNPMNNVIALMVFTVALGIIHLLFGLLLNIVQAFQKESVWESGLDSILWFGALSFGIILITASQGLLGSGLVLLMDPLVYIYLIYIGVMVFLIGRSMSSIPARLAKGLYDVFFGVVGYLSDILSYTRLVALGLATGIIASVVGTLANLAGGGLVEKGGVWLILGYIIMVIIFIVGNVFNIALNVLGTYINVGRLHFVEFFSKFFESGGKALKVMARSQEYSIIEKD